MLISQPALASHETLSNKTIDHVISRKIRDAMIATILAESGIKPNKTPLNPLTMQQILCLCLLASGQTTRQCAVLLNIQEDTVHKHEKRIREKLNAVHRLHAYHIARQKGYIIEHIPI